MFNMGPRRFAKFLEGPLLCKEGWRGGRGLGSGMLVSFALQFYGISLILPHLTPPLTKGRNVPERDFKKSPLNQPPWKELKCQKYQTVNLVRTSSGCMATRL